MAASGWLSLSCLPFFFFITICFEHVSIAHVTLQVLANAPFAPYLASFEVACRRSSRSSERFRNTSRSRTRTSTRKLAHRLAMSETPNLLLHAKTTSQTEVRAADLCYIPRGIHLKCYPGILRHKQFAL